MEAQNNAKLFVKLARVMGAVRTLKREGRNQFDKYDYMTADSISIRIGELLAENSVAFLPSVLNVETSEYVTQKGGSNFRTVVHMQMTFACGETGATYTVPWFGEAIDRSDKSISKAITSGVKYALLKTFLLAGGDEEDADAESPAVAGRAAPKSAPPSNGHNDDLWEPDNPKAAKAKAISSAQLTRIAVLGADVYKGEWAGNSGKLAEWASKGAVKSIDDLNSNEADALIKALEKRLAGLANGAVAK